MEEKRKKIIDTAFSLFTQRGFYNTPTSLIAKKAGVATGTLFHYFKNKEELINSLYLECRVSIIEYIKNGLDETSVIFEKAKHLLFKSIMWGIENKERFLFYQQFNNSPFISQFTKEKGTIQVKFIIDFIEEAKDKKIIKNISTDLIFNIIEGIKIYLIYYFLDNTDKLKDQKELNDAFNLLWDSIKF